MHLIRHRNEVIRARAAMARERARLARPVQAWEARLAAHPWLWMGAGFATGALVGAHPRQRRRALALMRLFGRSGSYWLVRAMSYASAAIAAARR